MRTFPPVPLVVACLAVPLFGAHLVGGCAARAPLTDATTHEAEAAREAAPWSTLEPCPDTPEIDPTMCRIDRLGDASMGWLAEGMAVDDLVARIGEPSGRDEPYEEGATGTMVFGVRWSDPPIDVRASYCYEGEGLCVEGFTVSEGFTEQTERGVGVGSTEADVLAAYADCIDPHGTQPGVRVTAGSVYGGMFFRIVDGRVASIYVGPGAE